MEAAGALGAWMLAVLEAERGRVQGDREKVLIPQPLYCNVPKPLINSAKRSILRPKV